MPALTVDQTQWTADTTGLTADQTVYGVATEDYASMEEALCDFIITRPGVSTVFGSGSSARLYPNCLPQGYRVAQGAAAHYEIISSDEQHTLSDRTGFVQSRVQFVCYARTLKAAIFAARTIRSCGITRLKGLHRLVDFRGIEIESGIRTDHEAPTDGSGEWRYLAEFDVMVSYLES